MQVLPIHLQYSPRFWIAEAIAFPDCFSFDASVPYSCHTLTLLLRVPLELLLTLQSESKCHFLHSLALTVNHMLIPKAEHPVLLSVCFLFIACKVFRCHWFGWPSFPHSYGRLQDLLWEEYVCGNLCSLHHITSTHCMDAKSVKNHAI